MTTPPSPPRLFVLMRPESERAVVLRRQGSKLFCSIGWDLASDTFTVGQWCKHALYPRRCDLSSDGRWMVYFALNGRWKSETLGAWTAVSLAPYLKAVKLWPIGSTWGGGALLFEQGAPLPPGTDWERLEVIDERHRLGGGSQVTRLLRDGWSHARSDGVNGKAFEKTLSPSSWVLRKKLQRVEWHQLRAPDGAITDCRGWEWADVDRRRERVVWAEAGAIHAARIGKDGLGDPELLFDARPMTFEPIKAPYG